MGSEVQTELVSNKLLSLRCSVQNYDWGVGGEGRSTVARLFEGNSGREIEAGRKYAEFWMGTHESGPSFVAVGPREEETLRSWVKERPGVLGEKVVGKWGTDLPFLFKV